MGNYTSSGDYLDALLWHMHNFDAFVESLKKPVKPFEENLTAYDRKMLSGMNIKEKPCAE